MPSDTGAPFFLPYPEDTDLVRDGASDIEALADATATALASAGTTDASDLTSGTLATARMAAGTIVQIQQGQKNDTSFFSLLAQQTVSSDIPGLSVTISPLFSNSIIFLSCRITTDRVTNVYMFRNGTAIDLANAAGSRSRGAFNGGRGSEMIFRDAPASTASLTYTVRIMQDDPNNARSVRVGTSRTQDDDIATNVRTVSRIIAYEVKV